MNDLCQNSSQNIKKARVELHITQKKPAEEYTGIAVFIPFSNAIDHWF